MLIDTHAHLNFRAYKDDLEEVLERCRQKPLAVINVGAQFSTSQRAAKMAQEHENFYATVGLHPIHVFDEPFNAENYQSLINNKVVAIGETGLDYWHLKFLKEPFKIVLLHGWGGNKNERFFTWLEEKLTSLGHNVIKFDLPNTEFPKEEEWVKEIYKQIGYANAKTILVGFSLGGVTSLRFLESLDEDGKIGSLFLLGTPFSHLNYEEIKNFFQKDFDWNKIEKTANIKHVIISGNDDVVPRADGEKLAARLKVNLENIGDHLHFQINEAPQILKSILDDIAYLSQTMPSLEQVIEKQKQVFLAQIDLALKNNLALMLHGRNGLEGREVYAEMLDIIKERKAERASFHCYGGTLELAEKITQAGYYIGLDGPVTFKKKAEDLQLLAKTVALDKILIETDCPYLTPEPFRGKRNEPIYVEYIAEKIAELRGISTQTVIERTWQNAKKVFEI